jgi:hypothetical protein
MENKEVFRPQSSPTVAFDVAEDKIESAEKHDGHQLEKHGDGYQSEKTAEGYFSEITAEGYMSERTRDGYQTHESDDTAVGDLKEKHPKPEKKFSDETENEEEEYVTGAKVLLILGAVTGACFILLLDMSIISTVCLPLHLVLVQSSNFLINRPFLASRTNFTHFRTLDGMAAHIFWPSMESLFSTCSLLPFVGLSYVIRIYPSVDKLVT